MKDCLVWKSSINICEILNGDIQARFHLRPCSHVPRLPTHLNAPTAQSKRPRALEHKDTRSKPQSTCGVMFQRLEFLRKFYFITQLLSTICHPLKVFVGFNAVFCLLGSPCSTEHFPTQTDNSVWWQPSVSLSQNSLPGVRFLLCIGWSLTVTYLVCYLLAHKSGVPLQNNLLILPAWKAPKIFINTLVSNIARRLLVYCKSI